MGHKKRGRAWGYRAGDPDEYGWGLSAFSDTNGTFPAR